MVKGSRETLSTQKAVNESDASRDNGFLFRNSRSQMILSYMGLPVAKCERYAVHAFRVVILDCISGCPGSEVLSELLPDDPGKILGKCLDPSLIFALDHDANLRFGAGIAHEESSATA